MAGGKHGLNEWTLHGYLIFKCSGMKINHNNGRHDAMQRALIIES